MTRVLDASALLAFLRDEPGAERVRDALRDKPVIASVNMGEVAHRLTLLGWPRQEVAAYLDDLPIVTVAVDRELALDAGFAVGLTKPFGLSLADRVCLMLAKRLSLPALTGDRNWLEIAQALGVEVELIR